MQKTNAQSQLLVQKPELLFEPLDEWFVRWRHFQTKQDWMIELRVQHRRRRSYLGCALVTALFAGLTTPYSVYERIFSPPHFFDIGYDEKIKTFLKKWLRTKRWWCPNGHMRSFVVFGPAYCTLVTLEHWNQQRRLKDYLVSKTIFGEQTRRYFQTGMIEEFLAVNLKATVPESEKKVMVQK